MGTTRAPKKQQAKIERGGGRAAVPGQRCSLRGQRGGISILFIVLLFIVWLAASAVCDVICVDFAVVWRERAEARGAREQKPVL
jgi:hypothetical protein